MQKYAFVRAKKAICVDLHTFFHKKWCLKTKIICIYVKL